MCEPVDTDVVVIGAGIAGAAAAWHLAAHVEVTVIERESQPGVHATGRSAALLTETFGPPLVSALVGASRPFLSSPPAGFGTGTGPKSLLSDRGVLWVARSEDRAALDAKQRAADQLGVEVQGLDPGQCRRLVDVVKTDVIAAGLHEPAAMTIDVDALLHGFLRGCRSRGAALQLGTEITAISRHRGRWRVEAGERRWDCGVVVNAAGAWCDQIAAQAGVEPLGLRPLRRSVFVFPPPPGLDIEAWPLVTDIAGRFYFQPSGGLILASPVDEILVEPGDARPEVEDIAVGVTEIEAATELRVRGVRRTWAGLRTFAPDGVPVAGFDPACPGFFWLAGQGGYGIKTAPAMGQLTAALVTGETGLPELVPRGAGLDTAGLDTAGLGVERLRELQARS